MTKKHFILIASIFILYSSSLSAQTKNSKIIEGLIISIAKSKEINDAKDLFCYKYDNLESLFVQYDSLYAVDVSKNKHINNNKVVRFWKTDEIFFEQIKYWMKVDLVEVNEMKARLYFHMNLKWPYENCSLFKCKVYYKKVDDDYKISRFKISK